MEDESSCIRRKAKQTIHSEDVAPTVGWWQSPGRWGAGGCGSRGGERRSEA